MNKWTGAVFLSVSLLSSFALQAKPTTTVVRHLGGACGERDDGTSMFVANCASGLSCKNGICEMQSNLSDDTVACKAALKKKFGYTGYVAVHNGYCYIDSSCHGLYDKVQSAGQAKRSLNTLNTSRYAGLPPEMQKKMLEQKMPGYRTQEYDPTNPESIKVMKERAEAAIADANAACDQCGKCITDF